jgi:YiiM-like, 3-alpha helix domain/MOSC domain
MDEPRMAALLVEHHRPGFYLRVLETGEVAAGDEIVKVSDGPERMSVAEADALLYLTGHSRAQLERALRIPALPAGWRGSFQALLQQGPNEGQAKGNPGLAVVSPPPAWTGFHERPLLWLVGGSDAFPSIETARVHHAARRRGGSLAKGTHTIRVRRLSSITRVPWRKVIGSPGQR